MTLAARQQQLVADFRLIPDPQERLAAVVDLARRRPPLSAAERSDAHRVRGCVSQAWIVGELREGRCHFRSDADSPLVRGLLALLCDCYDDAPAMEIMAAETDLLGELGLAGMLSPTRRHGLQSAAAAIRAYAAQAASVAQ